MSIEKLSDASKTELEQNPFAQICNSVIQDIKDNDSFRLYCFLNSKAHSWKVVKEWTAKVCGVGERKAKQCWAYLERCGLIQYLVIRDEKGKFVRHDIHVLNGTRFNPDEPFLKPTGAETAPEEKLSTEKGTHRCNNPPGGQSTRVVSAPLLNKDSTNKDFGKKKRKSFYANAQKKHKSEWRQENTQRHEWAEAMDNVATSQQQMDRETAHIAQNEAYKKAPLSQCWHQLVKQLGCRTNYAQPST